VDWDNDGKHDLLVGDVNGSVTVYKNTNTNTNPVLDSGTFVLDNGDDRAAPIVDDWDRDTDGKKDLLVGTFTGNIQVYINQGTDANPSFSSYTNLLVGGSTYDAGSRAAPRIYDWNGDGLKDILVGEYNGYVSYLQNVGSNSAPVFNTAEQLFLANGTELRYIDLANPPADPTKYYPRSRFDITDWNNDGLPDILSGGQDGRVMVFTSVAPEPVSATLFLVGSGILSLSRLRKKLKNRS
jgi:hypothetical protein